MRPIDFRSDTVTKPSGPMRAAMMEAELGDDVFGEDPTTNRLQERVANLLGKESALFVPSGTMGNEVCIKTHTHPGDEIILEQESHIFVYETGAPALLSGVQLCTLPGTKGMITLEQISVALRPRAYYLPKTKLICLENTHGRSAGSILPLEEIKRVHDFATSEHVAMHLDGARLWNACSATGIPPAEYARHFDSVSVCFSKGLGAPIGSMIAGSAEFIDRAKRYRKVFGGGMRQVGMLAAAALYALDHNMTRLVEDHQKARYFAEELNALQQLRVDLSEVQTNMVFIDIENTQKTQTEVLSLLRSHGILVTPERRSSIRAVMHLDVSLEEVKQSVQIIRSIFA